MYLLTELILFSPLIVYACIRARRLVSNTYLKNLFVPFYVLLFLGYPFAEVLSHRPLSSWERGAALAGYFCLPYLLYITLLVAAAELVIALMKGVGLLRNQTLNASRCRIARLSAYLLIPALIVFLGALNNNRLRIKEYSIELPQKSSAIKALKIAFASDFHLGQLTSNRLLERFVDKVNSLNPDLILIGGDVLEGHGNENLAGYESEFRRLKARYGVYAVPGNHESHGSESRNGFFARSGMRLLSDSFESIDNLFYLAGRNAGRSTRRQPIDDLLMTASQDLPVILLDHSPTDLENVSRSRVDLQLSGHTHNGQLFPVNLLVMPFEYELAWGSMRKGHTLFIVSSGLQAWGPPVKTAGDSEILLIKANFRPRQ